MVSACGLIPPEGDGTAEGVGVVTLNHRVGLEGFAQIKGVCPASTWPKAPGQPEAGPTSTG